MLDVWLPGPRGPVLLPPPLRPALLRVVTDPAWLDAATNDLEGTSFAVIGAVEARGPCTIGEIAASLERPDLAAPSTSRRIVAAVRDRLLLHVSPDERLRTWEQWADDATRRAAAALSFDEAHTALLAATGPLACLSPGV